MSKTGKRFARGVLTLGASELYRGAQNVTHKILNPNVPDIQMPKMENTALAALAEERKRRLRAFGYRGTLLSEMRSGLGSGEGTARLGE